MTLKPPPRDLLLLLCLANGFIATLHLVGGSLEMALMCGVCAGLAWLMWRHC